MNDDIEPNENESLPAPPMLNPNIDDGFEPTPTDIPPLPGQAIQPSASSPPPATALPEVAEQPHEGRRSARRRANKTTKPSRGGSKKRLGLIVVGVLLFIGVAGVGAWQFLGSSDDTSQKFLLGRGSPEIDVYVLEPGDEAGRSNRTVQDAVGLRTITQLQSDGEIVRSSLAAVGDDLVMYIVDESNDSVLLRLDGDTSEEIFSSNGFISVAVLDEKILIEEDRSGSNRCHVGTVSGGFERVARADSCSFNISGDVLSIDVRSERLDIEITSPDGSVMLSDSAEADSAVFSPLGDLLVISEGSAIEVLVIETGELLTTTENVVDYEQVELGSIVLGIADDDGMVSISLHGPSGETVMVESEDFVSATHIEGDRWLYRVAGDDEAEIFTWSTSDSESERVASAEFPNQVLWRVSQDGPAYIVETDTLGLTVSALDSEGTATIVAEYDADEMTVQRQEVLPNGDLAISGTSEDGSWILVAGPERDSEFLTDGWDGVDFVNTNSAGDLLVVVRDGSSEILATVKSGQGELEELAEEDDIGIAQFMGSSVNFEVVDPDDFSEIDVANVEPGQRSTTEYSGYFLIHRETPFATTSKSISVTPARNFALERCENGGLTILRPGDSARVTVPVGDYGYICARVSTGSTVTVSATSSDISPWVTVTDNDGYYNEPFDRRLEFDAPGRYIVIEVRDANWFGGLATVTVETR